MATEESHNRAEHWLLEELARGATVMDVARILGQEENHQLVYRAIATRDAARNVTSVKVGRRLRGYIDTYLDGLEGEVTGSEVAEPTDIEGYDYHDPGYEEPDWGDDGVAKAAEGDETKSPQMDAPAGAQEDVGERGEGVLEHEDDGAEKTGADDAVEQEAERAGLKSVAGQERVARVWAGELQSESDSRRRAVRQLAAWQSGHIMPLLEDMRDARSVLELTHVMARLAGGRLVAARSPDIASAGVPYDTAVDEKGSVRVERYRAVTLEVQETKSDERVADPARWWAAQVESPLVSEAKVRLEEARRRCLLMIAAELLGPGSRELAVMEIVPMAVAIRFALDLCGRDLSGRDERARQYDLMSTPEYLHGDALLVLTEGVAVSYQDPGAQLVGVSPPWEDFGRVTRVADCIQGVSNAWRWERYMCPDHFNRPAMLGVRMAYVVPTVPYPDEDHFFGSTGWTDEHGRWWPGRHEVLARMRHSRTLYEDWGAVDRQNQWHLALYEAYAEMELVLLHESYGMTFERLIRGEASWPRSTREGFETIARGIQVQANQVLAGQYRRSRRWLRVRQWPYSWIGKSLRVAVRQFRLTFAKPRHPDASWVRVGTAFRRWRLYDREDPPLLQVREEKPKRSGWRKLFNWTRFSYLYEETEKQGWLTRRVSWCLVRRHSELDGSVCGLRNWYVVDPPMTPDYVTPHPRSGYVASESFLRRFRPHLYEEPGYMEPEPEPDRVALRTRIRSWWPQRRRRNDEDDTDEGLKGETTETEGTARP